MTNYRHSRCNLSKILSSTFEIETLISVMFESNAQREQQLYLCKNRNE